MLSRALLLRRGAWPPARALCPVRTVAGTPTRALTDAEVSSYWRDGFLNAKAIFSRSEMEGVRVAVESDPHVGAKAMAMKDAQGLVSRLTLWSYVVPSTVYGAVAGGQRMVSAAARLIGEDPYHFHTKIMLKEPRSGGAWVAHSDFGYWNALGCLNPDVMMSCIVSIDGADEGNGCLKVLRGTHRLGRLEHGKAGGQAGADPRMLALAKARYETVACVMEPGDVLFTHSNLLHWSEANTSERWRRSMIVAYNGVSNPPFEDNGISPLPNPIHVVPDARVLELAGKGFDAESLKSATFLDEGRNVRKFTEEGQTAFSYKSASG
jgi:ectoine hydroxylase